MADRDLAACAAGTLESVSLHLQTLFPNVRGLSVRSVRRFCSERGIHYRSGFSDDELDAVVRRRVTFVGHSYGRRSLQGLLRAEGICVSQLRLGASLRRTFPFAQSQRSRTLGRAMNPIPYRAMFYGEKLHFDQNEKLVMFGVVHVLAVDGYSRKIVGFSTMPKKNPITIYGTIMQPLLLSEGIWDQLRSDYGTEFALVAIIQNHLSSYRVHQNRVSTLQTTSRQNHRAERIWPEINSGINYPVKALLVQMENEEVIDMRNETHKFCVSWVTIHVIESAIAAFVRAWNSHTIPCQAGGVPNMLAEMTRQITALNPLQVPSVQEAVALHETTHGCLTRESTYGVDPIDEFPHLRALRERDFSLAFPSMDAIFSDVLHGDGIMFRDAVLVFISLSVRFSELLCEC